MLALCEDLGPHCPSCLSHEGEVPCTGLPSSFVSVMPGFCHAVAEVGGRDPSTYWPYLMLHTKLRSIWPLVLRLETVVLTLQASR